MSTTCEKNIDIFSLEQPSSSALSISTNDQTSKQHFWSPISGSHLFSHSTSNIISIYDPRASGDVQVDINASYQLNRPSYSGLLDDMTIISTGTTASTRTRSLKLYDLRSPSTPKSIIPFDPSSSPSISLVPLVDTTRRLAYLAQQHSSSIFAFDFNDATPTPITLQLPSTIVGGALLPPTDVDVMRAEINRVYVLTRRDEIVPVPVRIERKVWLSFFASLIVELLGLS